MIRNITIGADPEVFLMNKDTKEIISAEGIIEGTKKRPKRVTDKGHCLQLDNVLAEFGIPPSTSEAEFYHNINYMLNYINENTPDEVQVAIKASAELDRKYLGTRNARTFGCDPSFNAWTGKINEAPCAEGNLRSAGGHIHVGYADHTEEQSVEIIKAMDLFLGVPSVFMDKDIERKMLYGSAGECRFPRWGVEYRTLSNFWLDSPELIKWAFNNTMKAIEFVNSGEEIDSDTQKSIIDAINYNDEAEAAHLVYEYDIPYIETEDEPVEVIKAVEAKAVKV
jgi:hypothetical protein